MSDKSLLQSVFFRLMQECTPQSIIKQSCRLEGELLYIGERIYTLENYRKICLLGSGKAVIPMAKAVQDILKERISHTLIVGAYAADEALENSTYIQSGHPLPSQQSLAAASALQEALRSLEKEDLFIYLLSGGSSALVELPEAPLALEEFQEALSLMLHGGMPIESINAVRKHLSRVKGGKMAELTQARGVVLVLSDVIGDDLHVIGSAPLYCDTTRFTDAIASLRGFSLFHKMPLSVQNFLNEGEAGLHAETPKQPHPHIDHHLLASNKTLLHKAQKLLHDCAIATCLIEKPMQGDVAALAQELFALACRPVTARHCYLLGGEATVTLTGEGKGGRNQHLCLSLLSLLKCDHDITFLSASSDGVDGNSDAAGAIIDQHSAHKAELLGLDVHDYLENFDSNSFFARTEELIVTGPTHNNLLDIAMMLITPKPNEGERRV